MITFAIRGYEGVNPALECGPLQTAFDQRGVRCRIVRSPRQPTKAPNQDRARVMVNALRAVALAAWQAGRPEFMRSPRLVLAHVWER